MSTHQLLGLCVVADGFPEDMKSDQQGIASFITRTTGVAVLRLAPLHSGRCWVFQVNTHADRQICLSKRSMLTVENLGYPISFYPPKIEDIPSSERWLDIHMTQVSGAEDQDSVSSDDLFGSGSPQNHPGKVTMETHGTPGYPERKAYPQTGPQSPLSYPMFDPSRPLQSGRVPLKADSGSLYPDLEHLQHYPARLVPQTQTSKGLAQSPGPGEEGYSFSYPDYQEGDQQTAFADSSSHRYSPGALDENSVFQSDFEVLTSPSDSLSLEPRRQYFLRVKELPRDVNEQELRRYFQDRKSGGGPVLKVDVNSSAGEAAIYFEDTNNIQRVVDKAPHLLLNKKIKVELASESQEQEKAEELRTVEIRDVPDETVKEMCLLYFENPGKGGGDIEDSKWNEEEKVLYITFADAAVAQQVITKGHTVGGNVLEVTLYVPPPPVEDKGQCTVEVRGFDPTLLELYQLYFENPKKAGAVATDFQFIEDEDVICVTFQTPEEAEQVVRTVHRVGGRDLQVTLAPTEDPATSQPHTVKVTRCDLQQTELYSLYFENPKKSGGGGIADTRVDEKEGAMYVTFEDPETVQSVCSRTHRVGGRDLEVTVFVPVTKKGKKSPETSDEKTEAKKEEEEPLKTVEVKVGNNIESEDTYMYYFEAKRHGGGDVEKVDIDREKGIVYVTFAKPEVALRVASLPHKISGQDVDVRLYVPPVPKPPYPDKLLFHNVAESTTRDCLAMYLERITGQEPTDLTYADEIGDVLAVFEEEPDFSKVQEMCQRKPLEGRKISVSRVPISNCILVENLSQKTTEDTLTFYFEGKRSGGGPLERVDLDHEEGRCLVFFENYEVIENILTKTHSLDGSKLEVRRYMECLGPSGGSRDANTFTLPKPVEFNNVDEFKVAFLRQSSTLEDGLIQKLKEFHAKPQFSNNKLTVQCTLTSSVPRVRVLARTWTNDVQDAVNSIFSMIVVLHQEVMQEIWDETEKAVVSIKPASRDSVVMFSLSKEKAFAVVGMQSMAEDLMKQVKQIVTLKEEEAERKKQEITETNKNLKLHQLRLLAGMSFQSEAAKRHQGLTVDIRTKKGEISFHGMVRDVKEAQVEMYELLQKVKSDKLTNVSDLQKNLLASKQIRDYVVQKFKSEKIVAVWDADSQGEIAVHSFDDNRLVSAIHIIQKSVVQHQQRLEPEAGQLLNSPEWKQLTQKLTNDNAGVLKIVPFHDGQQLFIAGTDNIMHGVVEEINQFFSENTIFMLSCHFFPARQYFVAKYWQDKVNSLSNNLRAYKVEVSLVESEKEFRVRGTQTGLNIMTKKLEELGSEVKCHMETLTDQDKVKFLSSSSCQKDLERLSHSVQCVFSLTEESANLVVEHLRSTPIVNDNMAVEENTSAVTVQLPSGVTIMAVQGDITKLPVDVIVNAANSRLDHIGGLARHIVDKGGKTIQDECSRHMASQRGDLQEGDIFMSAAGRLSCKAIIHAVGPMYKGGRSGEEDCLHDVVCKCLDKASSAGFSSIAIPALSAGIFGYPVGEATSVITEAVKTYFNTYRKTNLRQVCLCHIASDVVGHFVSGVQKFFPSAAPVKQKPKPSVRTRKGGQFAEEINRESHSVGTGTFIKISVIEGEIAQEDTDVIVNSTSNGLDLQNGAVSSSILKAAGPGLQDECRRQYPNGIQTTEVAFTTSHNLRCKGVLHLALCNYSNPNAAQILGQLVIKCMQELNRRGYRSITFPPLGTGNLGYPLGVVAQTMVGAVQQFEKDARGSSVREVKIIVYNSPDTVKAFRAHVGKFHSTWQLQDSPRGSVGSRQHRVFSEMRSPQSSGPGCSPSVGPNVNSEFDLGGLRLIVKQGDITEEKVDAIINSSNSSLDLSRGAVAGALKQKCGAILEKECKKKAAEMSTTGIVSTKVKGQSFKSILHIDAERFSDNWKSGILEILKRADDLGIVSISTPALGTGAYGLTASSSARNVMDALCDFCNGKRRHLQELRIVMFDKSMVPQTIHTIQQVGEKLSKSRQGVTGFFRAIAGFGGPSLVQIYSQPVIEEAKLFVFGESPEKIRKALQNFDDLVKDKFTRKEIVDDVIQNMSEEEIQEIRKVGQQHSVELQIQNAVGRIVIDGMQANVFDAGNEINKIIREADRRRQQEQQALMLVNMVQWCYLEVTSTATEQREYKERENQIIESAYQARKKSATIKDASGTEYIIDFDSMKEYPASDPRDTVDVIRKDKMKESSTGVLPENWTIQPDKEILKLAAVDSKSPEFQQVENNFKSTLGKNKTLTVSSIDRIENPTQYRQYMAKKAHLDKQNTGIQNEKTLWHGTSSDALSNINNYGFNRSYCGKNAVVYGQGVYFAVNSEYSTHPTYSPPDPSTGHRYIYQCRVLVGHPIQGNQTMRILPPRSGHILYDSSTDNLQKPALYAIFNDTQAYPEYLITFR